MMRIKTVNMMHKNKTRLNRTAWTAWPGLHVRQRFASALD